MFGILRNKGHVSPIKAAEAPSLRKTKDEIDPVDGKTKACDRAMTFESFVERRQIGGEECMMENGQKRGVRKGLGKIKGCFGRHEGGERRAGH